jgi:hypothetical protein
MRARVPLVTAALAAATLGTAHEAAAETRHPAGTAPAPVVALINIGQINDPMEDVLEHTLLLGGSHSWD